MALRVCRRNACPKIRSSLCVIAFGQRASALLLARAHYITRSKGPTQPTKVVHNVSKGIPSIDDRAQ